MQKEEKNNENANLDKGLKRFKFKLKAAEKAKHIMTAEFLYSLGYYRNYVLFKLLKIRIFNFF